jgi:hypothetical protein
MPPRPARSRRPSVPACGKCCCGWPAAAPSSRRRGRAAPKLWFHSAATAARQTQAEDDSKAQAKRERERYWKQQRTRYQRYQQAHERWEAPSAAAADPTRAAILDRAAKLMGMLGSMHEGERLAAAQALETLRRRHDLDWVDFLATAGGPRRRKAAGG